jgi:hypothetical protein
MRRQASLVLVVLSLVLSLGSAGLLSPASARPARAEPRTGPGLLITFRGWGRLHHGMTPREAQHTGMVSRLPGRCAPGFLLVPHLQTRGSINWGFSPQPLKVRQIVITGRHDHTRRGIHPGTRLAALRREQPHLSTLVSAGSLRGVHQPRDLWLTWVQTRRGTIIYQFPFGRRPTGRSRLDTIIVSSKPSSYYGC